MNIMEKSIKHAANRIYRTLCLNGARWRQSIPTTIQYGEEMNETLIIEEAIKRLPMLGDYY